MTAFTGWSYADVEYGVATYHVNGHPIYFMKVPDEIIDQYLPKDEAT